MVLPTFLPAGKMRANLDLETKGTLEVLYLFNIL